MEGSLDQVLGMSNSVSVSPVASQVPIPSSTSKGFGSYIIYIFIALGLLGGAFLYLNSQKNKDKLEYIKNPPAQQSQPPPRSQQPQPHLEGYSKQ